MEAVIEQQRCRLTDLVAFRHRGGRPALFAGREVVSYGDLADRIDDRIAELAERGVQRRVVSLHATNTIDTVVTYLACLVAGHVVSVRRPVGADAVAGRVDPFAGAKGTALHPELAALLSTSGTTGSAKSVRLSLANIESNADAIAESLRLRADDVAITSLPLHYCYGLSIVTSHLTAGASVVVTDCSVVDPCFWELVEQWGVTTLSGVPHTFDLIDRLLVDPLAAGSTGSSIRRVTQAGGRLRPDSVRRFAERGQRHGWDFFVMYGQTEATARMTVLDPDLAAEHPGSIGQPIPGGSIRLEPVPLDDVPSELHDEVRAGAVGEIVYRGPNVMLGHASSVADLAVGRSIDELHTGDIARLTDDGLLEIVGRRSRFVKILGHRIDLDELDARFEARGAAVAGDDERLVVVTAGANAADLRADLASLPLPASAVQVTEVDELPRLPNGKLDRVSLIGTADPGPGACPVTSVGRESVGRATSVDPQSVGRESVEVESVGDVYCHVLGVASVDAHDSFTSLGGDSLSYVEASIRLERAIGELPLGWHQLSIGQLDRLAVGWVDRPAARRLDTFGARWRGMAGLDTGVVIRAIGICVIVSTHMGLARLAGGAHTLLAVAGFNFARFQLGAIDLPGRVRRGLTTVARVAVPTSLWIGLQMLIVGGYSAGSLFLVNNYFGSPWRRDGRWEYWYFEAFVQIFVVLTLLFAIGPVRRFEQRRPFGFAFGALLAAIVVGLQVVEFGDGYNAIFRPHTTVWFVLLGWAGQRATTPAQRLLVTAVLVGGSAAYFDRWQQAVMVIVLVGALLWRPTVRLPRAAVPVVGTIAAASMVVFLVHWQVWPIYTSVFVREVAYVLTLATGVGVWACARWAGRRFGPGITRRFATGVASPVTM